MAGAGFAAGGGGGAGSTGPCWAWKPVRLAQTGPRAELPSVMKRQQQAGRALRSAAGRCHSHGGQLLLQSAGFVEAMLPLEARATLGGTRCRQGAFRAELLPEPFRRHLLPPEPLSGRDGARPRQEATAGSAAPLPRSQKCTFSPSLSR